MQKSKTFNVKEKRIFFKCPHCKFKRMLTVPPNIRRRTVRCPKCMEKTVCILNRRQMTRTGQSGRVFLFVGTEMVEVNLFDISEKGAGFELDPRTSIKIITGREIELKCKWNPRLFSKGRYIVKSVRGCKVGVEQKM